MLLIFRGPPISLFKRLSIHASINQPRGPPFSLFKGLGIHTSINQPRGPPIRQYNGNKTGPMVQP